MATEEGSMSEEILSGVQLDAAIDSLFTEDGSVPGYTEATSAADTSTDTVTDQPDATSSDDSVTDTEEPGEVSEPGESDDKTTEPAKEEKPSDQQQQAAADDQMEGAQLRERNGKREYVFTEERGKTVYAGYKIAKEAEAVLGEPLSVDALQQRQNAHEWLQGQKIDLVSPDPAAQSNIFRNLFREAAGAMAAGEIGHDPLETVGEAFLDTLRETAPEHYERAASYVMASEIERLYEKGLEAKNAGNDKLLRAIQNLDYHLTGKYIKDDDLAKRIPDAITRREQELAAREQRIQQSQVQHKQAQWRNWGASTSAAIGENVRTVIDSQIPETVKTAFSSLPNGAQRIENIQNLLDLEIRKSIKADPKWKQHTDILYKQAELAPTEQRRDQIKQEIVQRYAQRARQVMAAKAAQILSAETLSLKQTNAATHNRQKAAAEQKGTTGSGKPPARSIPESAPPGSQSWEEYLEAAF